MATIADVAARAGVSIATVSRVLSPGARAHPVKVETARRVRAAAHELDFVPSALARGLVSRRSELFGLVVPDLADPHYPQIASGVEEAARQAGLAVLICNTLGEAERLADDMRLLRSHRADAVLVSGGGSLDDGALSELASSGLPVVLIGRPWREPAPPYVSVDNRSAAAAATRHLVSSGRRRLVHLAGPSTQTTMFDRAAGFRDAVRAAGLAPEIIDTDGSTRAGVAALSTLLARPAAQRPDGLFAATDRLAIVALAAAADAGVAVPDELAIVGFDDLPVAQLVRPALSTVSQPAHELGAAAIRLATALLANEPVAPIILPAALVIRASSRRS